jgi:hypothetical protein
MLRGNPVSQNGVKESEEMHEWTLIGNRAHDLPACSKVLQSPTLTRAPKKNNIFTQKEII